MTTSNPQQMMVQPPMKRPLLTVIAGLIVCSLAVYALFTIYKPLGIVGLVILLLLLIFSMLMYSFEANSALISRCLQIDKDRAFMFMAISTIVVPLYPVVALPLMMSSGILLMMGRCGPE